MVTPWNKLLLVSALSLLIAGCADIRKVTYPPEFTYIEKSQLQGSMHGLAAAMTQLDTLVADVPTADVSQKEVLTQLDLIDRIAWGLSGGKATNHLLIDAHMEQFSADVAKARLMAAAEPPNYFYAGHLAGSCSGCHRFR